MQQIWSKFFGSRKSRRERLADEAQLPSLSEMRAAKALGHHRKAAGVRNADAARRLDEAMNEVGSK